MKFGNEYCDKCGQNARACECDGSALKLARAQADYETAVAAKADADKAVNDAYRKVAAARERVDQAKREVAAQIPVDREQKTLSDGSPVTDDHRDLKSNGQQKGYVVLSDAERARGFVRPVRLSYRHVGSVGPKNPLRDLTPEEHARYDKFGYLKYEEYPKGGAITGKFWTKETLAAIGAGCGTVTTMGQTIAETYARDPSFYGSTFCCGCGKHLRVGADGEFVWDGTDERVGT